MTLSNFSMAELQSRFIDVSTNPYYSSAYEYHIGLIETMRKRNSSIFGGNGDEIDNPYVIEKESSTKAPTNVVSSRNPTSMLNSILYPSKSKSKDPDGKKSNIFMDDSGDMDWINDTTNTITNSVSKKPSKKKSAENSIITSANSEENAKKPWSKLKKSDRRSILETYLYKHKDTYEPMRMSILSAFDDSKITLRNIEYSEESGEITNLKLPKSMN